MKAKFPLSKSWTIRMIFLDMVYGKETDYSVIASLGNIKNQLCDDIKAALSCARVYLKGKSFYNVGNSATVCRFLMYFLDGRKFKIQKGSQLAKRRITTSKNISRLPLAKLLKLGTSQFASAALLKGVKPIKDLPIKCRLSVEARKVYFKNRGQWVSKEDEVIKRQLEHFLNGNRFKPLIAEDYCYARAFGSISQREGEKLWPELRNHECNRLEAMEEVMKNLNKRVNVHGDHRIAMAVALRQKYLGLSIRINDRKCVKKSWPKFWQWLKENS